MAADSTPRQSVLGRTIGLLGSIRALPGGALDNARQAARDLSVTVAQRTLLTAELGTDADQGSEPGALGRLTRQECLALLAARQVGRLAYIARAGVPDIVVVNYAMDGTAVLIASGPGPKLQAAERRDLVAFEVDDVDETARRGRSVVLVGRAKRLSATEQDRLAGALPEPWATGPRRGLIRIEPGRLEGRRLS